MSSSRLAGPALALVSLLLSLALVEGLCHLALPLKQRRSHYKRVMDIWQYDPARVRFDPVLGYANQPNLDTVFANPELGGYTTRVRTNAAGFRDEEDAARGAAAIFLGDSFCFGWGVGQDETVEARFQARTGRRSANFGVSGYGTVQEALLLDSAVPKDLAGVTVVLMVYANDLEDLAGYGFGVWPRVTATKPTLAATRATAEAYARWHQVVNDWRYDHAVFRRSFVGFQLGRLGHKLGRLAGVIRPVDVPGPTDTPEEKLRAFAEVLAHMKGVVEGRGGRLRAVYIPLVTAFTDGESSQFERFQPAFAAHQVPCLDATPLLGAEDYWVLDGHWRPAGHDKVAARLAETW